MENSKRIDLEGIRIALAKATKGTWKELRKSPHDFAVIEMDDGDYSVLTETDVETIVLLRNNASAMIDRIEELEKENKGLREVVSNYGINPATVKRFYDMQENQALSIRPPTV